MAQGDLPTSRGGSLQRRKEKRQLEQLAQAAKRDGVAPTVGTPHVRVLEDQVGGVNDDRADVGDTGAEGEEPGPPADGVVQRRTGGFQVRAVPIDQPLGE